jgi:hypothetical protein
LRKGALEFAWAKEKDKLRTKKLEKFFIIYKLCNVIHRPINLLLIYRSQFILLGGVLINQIGA